MISVPPVTMTAYVEVLVQSGIPSEHIEHYKKWLRYFHDFSAKYLNTDGNPEGIRKFLDKLRSKGQTAVQCQQAAHAVSLYFELQRRSQYEQNSDSLASAAAATIPDIPQISSRPPQYSPAGYQEKSDSPEWDALVEAMAAEIKVRHYSRKTLQTYSHWGATICMSRTSSGRSTLQFERRKSPRRSPPTSSATPSPLTSSRQAMTFASSSNSSVTRA